MASEWTSALVADIAEKVAMGPFGSSIKVETFVSQGIPVISGQHLHGTRLDEASFNYISPEHADRLAHANVQKGDVIFTHAGNIGQVAYIPYASRFERYVISQRQFYLRPNRKLVLPEYLAYYFTSPEGQHKLLANTSSSGVPSIAQPVTYLRTIDIPLPPLPEQRAIAHILGTLDDKIELNRRMNETLEAMARALFQSWFVDFDPVRRNMDRRAHHGRGEGHGRGEASPSNPDMPELRGDASPLPQHPHVPFVSDEIDAFFPDGFEDSELGEIPRGWKVGTLGDVVAIHDSRRIPLSSRQRTERKGPYPYYGAASMMDYVDDYLFDGIYVLVGEDGSVINNDDTPVTQYVWGQFWVNNHAHVLTGKAGITNEHLLLYLRQVNIRPFITGAVQPKLNQGNLTQLPFTYPGNEIAVVFGRLIEPHYTKYRTNNDETCTLTAIRDTLLPKLISGELRVRDAERFVGQRL